MSNQASKHFRLSDYRGDSAEIVRLDLPEAETLRLKSLGIFAGQSIELRKAGNPLILTAAGGRVAIAAEVARQIVVQSSDHRAA